MSQFQRVVCLGLLRMWYVKLVVEFTNVYPLSHPAVVVEQHVDDEGDMLCSCHTAAVVLLCDCNGFISLLIQDTVYMESFEFMSELYAVCCFYKLSNIDNLVGKKLLCWTVVTANWELVIFMLPKFC